MRLRVILFLMKIVGSLALMICVTLVLSAGSARALDREILNAIVRIKPDWSLAARGRDAAGKPRDPQGTGVAVMPGGYIATNVHVIGDAADIDVMTEDGRILKAAIVGRDKATDIALIKVEADLPILDNAPAPELAEAVCAIGNQFGLGLSVTCGVVSAVGRSGMGFNPVEDFIQTDAAVNPGGSGGALVDMKGRLVGMVAAIFTKSSDADIGVNFATSVPLLMRVVNDLKAHGHVMRGVAGFKAGPLPPSMARAGGGVMVESVIVDGPAFKAGLEAGDIITHVDGDAVSSMPVLEVMLFKKRPGETINLDTRRGGEKRTLNVALGGS